MKIKSLNFIISSSVLFLASGCSSISKEECKTGDWNGIGYRDGSAGKPLARVQSYIEDCGKAGATVDRSSYEKGRNEGLKVYCTKENGINVGRDGASMFQECPANMRSTFAKAWEMGRRIYDLKRKLRDVENEMSNFEKTLDNPNTSAVEKSTLRSRLRELQRTRDDLNRDITKAEMQAENEMGHNV